MNNHVTTQQRCISVAEAVGIIGFSKSTLYSLLADKTSDLPRPIKIGRRTYFIEGEVMAWIASRPRLTNAIER
ncbi:putative DNA-binding transcriptional regulator AlpA [Herbaspirillum seropedicae]|uniref:helix-turn-helix transcriptional regulator n=1 Tax=Herbaspirillum seropedicae TaxID=964 RepID=UPI00339419A3